MNNEKVFMSLTRCFCQERVSELECEVREKHKMEIKLQSLIEVRLIYHVYIGRFQTHTLPHAHTRRTRPSVPSWLPSSRWQRV